MSKEVKFLTRTAMLLALTIVFQIAGRLIPTGSNFIVGPLVNACLIVSTGLAGIWSGIIISAGSALYAALFTPVGSMFLLPTGYAAFVALGNASLVIMYVLFKRKNEYAGIITGAVIKFIIIFGSLKLYLDVFGLVGKAKPPVIEKVLFVFSWPQLITAVTGGIIALIILRRIKNKIN